MKYATFIHQGQQLAGILDPGRQTVQPLAFDMLTIIQKGHMFQGPVLPLSAVQLLAPIANPPHNVVCVGKNYHEHLKEVSHTAPSGDSVPEYPIFFTKASTCIIGPNEPIILPTLLSQKIDYEAELAVIIGKRAKNISESNAAEYIFGYMIANDVTARDVQKRHQQWFLGKSLDGFLPTGPWIVTADEVNAHDLTIRCWVNQELRQQASTASMIFSIPKLLQTLTAGMTLEAGDIVITGTPAGVGMGFNPPRFLKNGDNIRIEISQLGMLINPVVGA